MRAGHWYDCGSLAGNSNLFVQVVAHQAAAATPHSVLQYVKARQITAKTPFLLSCKTRSDSHSAAWEGTLQIHGDIEPSPVVLGEEASMERTTRCFQTIATTLADLNAEGFNAQAVNNLPTMYVRAASQHVLRISFVPEQEASNFDRQVTTFWSHLIQRDVTSPLFFLHLKLGGLGVGSAVQRHAAAPWRA